MSDRRVLFIIVPSAHILSRILFPRSPLPFLFSLLNMPFFWRKKHQLKPSALTIHSAEQLSTFSSQQNNNNTHPGSSFPDFHRSSDLRSSVLRTDRQQPLHRPSQSQSHSQAQASQEPTPEPASIRRTQTAHLLQDAEPVRSSSTIYTTNQC